LDDWIYCTLYIHNSGLQVVQRYCLFTHFTVHRYTRTRILSSLVVSWQWIYNSLLLSLEITHEVFFEQSNSCLVVSSQSPSTAISGTPPNSRQQLTQMNPSSTELSQLLTTNSHDLSFSRYNPRHGPAENTASSLLRRLYLLIRCLAMDVLLLRAFSSAGMCLPSRCLTMGIHVTLSNQLF
jgi:hypothetical protein